MDRIGTFNPLSCFAPRQSTVSRPIGFNRG